MVPCPSIDPSVFHGSFDFPYLVVHLGCYKPAPCPVFIITCPDRGVKFYNTSFRAIFHVYEIMLLCHSQDAGDLTGKSVHGFATGVTDDTSPQIGDVESLFKLKGKHIGTKERKKCRFTTLTYLRYQP